MTEPLITIIILHWRTYGHTSQCLKTLAELDYTNYRILLADNGSHDGSFERLQREFPEVETLEYATNLGFAAGINPAMRRALEAGSDYVLLINSDVLVAPDLLTRLAAAAEAHHEIGIMSPKTVWEAHPDRLAGLGCRVKAFDIELIGWDVADTASIGDEPVVLECVFGSAMLLSRRMLEQVGLFDERFFFYYEDIDLCLRARDAGFLAAYLPSATVRHAVSASVRNVRGLRDFYLARSRQLFFRKYRTGLFQALYTLRELVQVLRTIRIRLKEGSPSGAVGYAAGALSGLVMPVRET